MTTSVTRTCKKCGTTRFENGEAYIESMPIGTFCPNHDWQEPEQQYREIQQAPKLGKLTREQIQRAVDSVSKRKREPKMPIKFIVEEPDQTGKELKFKHVQTDEFFVNYKGWLCQKINSADVSVIAIEDGTPRAYHHCYDDEMEIQRILPKIKKIEF